MHSTNFSQIFIALAITLVSLQSSAWPRVGFASTDSPARWCVRDGIFFGDVKCVPMDAAEKLGYDSDKIFGAPSNASDLAQMANAQAEITRATKDYEKKQEEYENVQTKLKRLKYDLDGSHTKADFAVLEKKLADLDLYAEETRKKAQTAKEILEQAKAQTGIGNQLLAETELKKEIARKGLMIKVNELDGKLAKFEDNLAATERELNNTALEAFVIAKIDRLAGSFCSAKTMCDKDASKVRSTIMEAVASKELRDSFKSGSSSKGASSSGTAK